MQISYVTLGVDDVSRATRFYADAFGLTPTGSSNDRVSFFELGSLRLALYGRADLARLAGLDGPPRAGARLVSAALVSTDRCLSCNVDSPRAVDEGLQRLGDAGGRITAPAADTDWGGYAGFGADPDGHLWEIVFNPRYTTKASTP